MSVKVNSMSKKELAEQVKKGLLEGYSYDEALNLCNKTPEEDASQCGEAFFDMCENGMNPFEAYVKAFTR